MGHTSSIGMNFDLPFRSRVSEPRRSGPKKIAKTYGFELLSHKHEMYGTCSECLAKGRGAKRNGN